MSFLVVGAIGVAAGAAQAISGAVQKKRAKEAKEQAQAEMDQQKEKYASMDTSNLYANMENVMEDLTVNTKQAEFEAQQNQQNQANILASMKSAAGGSGVASLAQAMANQGQLAAQKASISIGKQEQANQMAERREAGRLQDLDIKGQYQQRAKEEEKLTTLMGMTAADIEAARAEQAMADEKMWKGIGSAASSAGSAYGQFKAQ